MPIDIRVLRYCEAIARHGSFTKAAKELRVAQPALSIAVKKLEDELGVILFVREARKVVASPEARLLLRHAEQIFEELKLAHQELHAAAELRVGEVKVGMPPMYGLHFFPRVIAEFNAAFPSVVITAMEGSADEVRAMLDSGAIDVAMLEDRRVPAGWHRVEVGQDEIILCVPQGHPYAERKNVLPQDLDGLRMVVFDSSFLQRSVLDQLCNKVGAQFRLVLQSNFVPLIHQAVADGLGAATLLRSTVEQDSRLVPLSFRPPEMAHFSLCWRHAHSLSKANAKFVEVALGQHQRAREGRSRKS
jgi:DNA-binding transcriptional LysR family regulator